MPNDKNGLDEPGFTDNPTSDKSASLKDLEIAMLRFTQRVKDHITGEMRDLKKCTNEKFKELPCDQHSDDIKKNANNHKTLVIVLIVTGALSGGGAGYGAAKLVSLLAGG